MNTIFYDATGRVIERRDNNQATFFHYDDAANELVVTRYDAYGQPIQNEHPPEGNEVQAEAMDLDQPPEGNEVQAEAMDQDQPPEGNEVQAEFMEQDQLPVNDDDLEANNIRDICPSRLGS